jgi:hypothetical protein
MADDEIDKMTAQGLALEIAAIADKLLNEGANALLVAGAMIGCGVELLNRIESRDKTARTLEGLAAKLRMPAPSPPTKN